MVVVPAFYFYNYVYNTWLRRKKYCNKIKLRQVSAFYQEPSIRVGCYRNAVVPLPTLMYFNVKTLALAVL